MDAAPWTNAELPDDPTEIRLALLRTGYEPTPVCAPSCQHIRKDGKPCQSHGKAVHLMRWAQDSFTASDVRQWARSRPLDTNTGIRTGRLVGVDVDVANEDLADKIDALAHVMLGHTPLRRVGRAPRLLRCYRTETPLPKLETPERKLGGETMQVEVMGKGQQVAAYGTHPVTMQPYRWLDREPVDVPLAELPIVAEAQLRAFLAAADAILAAGGAELVNAKAEAPTAPSEPVAPAAAPDAAKPAAAAPGGDFFRNVNKAALANIAAWFPVIFPKARQEAGTGAWRVSSAHLGRELEEDLSMHPTNGGRDWGANKALTPVNAVIQWSDKKIAKAAAFWLCDRLGKRPEDFGWAKKADHSRAFGGPAPISSPRADLGKDDLTEDGLALAFAKDHKDHLRFCHDAGAWFHWDGTIWRRERTKLAFAWAREGARLMLDQLNMARDDKVKFSRASVASAVERFAQSDRAFAVTSETWDADPWLLGTPGGTVDLRTGELRPARREDYITKTIAVAPAAASDCPLWKAFLDQATNNDGGLITFLQQWCGYNLTGDVREHALVFVHGDGGNGKGTWLNTVSNILGDYCRTAAMDTFVASKGDRHPADLAALRGARMVCASETEEGRAWSELRIKQLTGGDRISARFMRQDFFEYNPQFKLTVIGNHMPELHNVNDAARRRFNMAPFTHKPKVVDKQLQDKLQPEWPGILRWMIDGCLDWQKNGLVRPEVVRVSTEEYFSEQDLMAQWLDECCVRTNGDGVATAGTVASLLSSWREYAKARGEEPGGSKGFSTAMQARGFKRFKNEHSIRARGFYGIKVRDASDPSDDPPGS